jgi:hypothetical protein
MQCHILTLRLTFVVANPQVDAMGAKEWAGILRRQFTQYYRRPPKALPSPARAAAEAPKEDNNSGEWQL